MGVKYCHYVSNSCFWDPIHPLVSWGWCSNSFQRGRMLKFPTKMQMKSSSYKCRCLGGHPLSAWALCKSPNKVAVSAGALLEAAVLSSLMVVLFPVGSKNSQTSWKGCRVRNGLKKNFPSSSVQWGAHRTFLACRESCWFSLSTQMIEWCAALCRKSEVLLLSGVALSQLWKIIELQSHFMLLFVFLFKKQSTWFKRYVVVLS